MSTLWRSRWVTWPATALFLSACFFPSPLPTASPSSSQPHVPIPASKATPVLIPTHTPSTAIVSENALSLAQQQLLAGLPALGTAPELQNETWFNSAPLQLVALRGKVVMVEFWTYG